jgi:predicted dehydrogenase
LGGGKAIGADGIQSSLEGEEDSVIGAGVIGYGYWGPNLARNFAESPAARLLAVSDSRADRLALAATRYPGIETSTDYRTLLANKKIDALAIATPVATHFELAMAALQAGKHVLVEKVLTATSEQAQRLVEEADRRSRVLMVDHTFVYAPPVAKVRDLVLSGHLGEVYYYDSVRVNLGLFQRDVNVVWDLAVHDLSIMDYVLGSRPVAVSATGMSHVSGAPENVAYLTFFFDRRLIAHIHVNWLAPVKVRKTLVGGSQKMVVYDDLEPSEKVKVYDKGVTVSHDAEEIYRMRVGYRMGDMWAPQIEAKEPLQTELAHFVRCIEKGERPLTDGRAGLYVVRSLEAATKSMNQRGRPVELKQESDT